MIILLLSDIFGTLYSVFECFFAGLSTGPVGGILRASLNVGRGQMDTGADVDMTNTHAVTMTVISGRWPFFSGVIW